WVNPAAWQMQNVFLITVPATIVFAWLFFWFCERPFMSKKVQIGTKSNSQRFVDEKPDVSDQLQEAMI
ncbi:MAG TPA: hypothetical protein VLE19_10680, partial [Pyrinomonadaceae bacterium]|nr:hypothetical protein [Pyrinomonadaceae bacterium]